MNKKSLATLAQSREFARSTDQILAMVRPKIQQTSKQRWHPPRPTKQSNALSRKLLHCLPRGMRGGRPATR